MASKKQNLFRIHFINQGTVYEIYAKHISHSALLGFLEIEELVFNNKSQVVVDPSEEKLKLEFDGVKRTYIPVHSVIRIDEVLKQGSAKITELAKQDTSNIALFPNHIFSPHRD